MGFRRSDLQEAFFVPGTWPFRVWGYGITDPLGTGRARRPGDGDPAQTRPRPPAGEQDEEEGGDGGRGGVK
jgi:hypothetical protein